MKKQKKSLVGYMLPSHRNIFRYCYRSGRGRIQDIEFPWVFRNKDEGCIKVRITIEELP